MAKKQSVKQFRVTFTEGEEEIYEFLKSKSNGSGLIKDLVKIEMKRQENLMNFDSDKLVQMVLDKLNNKSVKSDNIVEDKTKNNLYDIEINIDDL